MYSSWLSISLPDPSKFLIQSGSSVCAIFTNSSMAAKASSRYIDLSIDLSTSAVVCLFVAGDDTTGKDPESPPPKSCPKGIVVDTPLKFPKPLVPTPSSNVELGNGGAIEEAKDEMGRPRNFPARAQTRSNSSFKRAFSILRCCSSSEISPMIAGPPQLEQIGFLIASLIDMFSARSLSFSCRSNEFSCRSSWVWSPNNQKYYKIATEIKKRKGKWKYLHLGSAILEPEFDLTGL